MTRDTSPNTTTSPMDDRGISEVLSFILVFSMLLVSVGVVGLVGFQSIGDYQDVEQLGNAERAMDAFADNANDVVRYDGVTRRSGDLALRGGTVSPGDSGSEVNNLTVYNSTSDPVWNWSDEYDENIGAFTYETDSETIAYEGGGVFRSSDDGGSAVTTDPMLTCRENTALVSLVKINSSDDRSIQSPDGVEFDVRESENATTREYFNDTENVTIDVDGEHADGWEMYFENTNDPWEPDPNSDGWKCEVDRVSIDIVEVEIGYPGLD
ncbi:hypothetical protein ACLI4Z_11665 [Natrialbaceae archaeon A-arb3/5]